MSSQEKEEINREHSFPLLVKTQQESGPSAGQEESSLGTHPAGSLQSCEEISICG